MISCIRGAITVEENTKVDILKGTRKLLEGIISANKLEFNEIISITFTCTRDLDKAYPAVEAREIGLTEPALMCLQEMYVEGSLEKCIRVMVMVESNRSQNSVNHVYLEGASVLRPDLKQGGKQ